MENVTRLSVSTLSVCVSLVLLAGCGGGGSGSDTQAQTNSATSVDATQNASRSSLETSSTASAYPEPTKDLFDNVTLGFYDQNAQGTPRTIRNDLTGNFEAMIQFAQSHTVDPSGNEAKQMPRLTSEKDALLLVTPTEAMGSLKQLNAEIYLNSRLIRRVALSEPTKIPAPDQSNSDNRPPVQYSKRAWTTALKWDEIKPGLNIRIVDPTSRKNGRLNADAIDFAPPAELLVQSIRVGMLTAPVPENAHYMLNQPAKAGTDYLQTIPAAQITVTKYDDIHLKKVMISSGVIYDTVSSTNGDVYSGDMRGDTAKSTFSTGINLANWGITSAGMMSQQQPHITQTTVIHHARGKYQNGDVSHGLSGGNGILTLYTSAGNEFSHEIGHHFGLGHYPGQNGDNFFLSSHHHDSGWGYIAYRDRMRGNINWNPSDLNNRMNGTPLFQDTYKFGTDSMAGGHYSSSLSSYAHYTGYSTNLRIQPSLNRAVWDATSPTGYKRWNATTRQMEPVQLKVPTSNQVFYNSADGNYLKPKHFGVPVFTILGGYDPVANVGLLYPAARGNWGNVFNLPQASTTGDTASCWINVQYATKAAENIALAPNRMGSNANKLHVNLAQSDNPKHVDLYCKKAGEQAVKLSEIDIPTYATPLPAAVIVGKSREFSDLRKVELPQLGQALEANADKTVVSLSSNNRILYDSYKNFKHELSTSAQQQFDRYALQENNLYRLNRWINVYRNDLTSASAPAAPAFKAFVTQLGLPSAPPMAGATMLVMPNMNGACLKAELNANGKPSIYMSGKNGCTGDNASLWIYDVIGKIHSVQYPGYCLSGANIALCNNNNGSQMWTKTSNGSTEQIHQGNSCLDLHSGNPPAVNGRGILTTYGCNGGRNQRWTIIPQSNNLILATASSQNLPVVVKALNTP